MAVEYSTYQPSGTPVPIVVSTRTEKFHTIDGTSSPRLTGRPAIPQQSDEVGAADLGGVRASGRRPRLAGQALPSTLSSPCVWARYPIGRKASRGPTRPARSLSGGPPSVRHSRDELMVAELEGERAMTRCTWGKIRSQEDYEGTERAAALDRHLSTAASEGEVDSRGCEEAADDRKR